MADVKATYEKEDLNRSLQSRHMQMIAIGGAIGTGLFLGSSGSIHFTGPSVILAYAFFAIPIYFVVRALGEMAVAEPVGGASVSYASRYIHRFAGFALGWFFFYTIAVVGNGAEYNALGQYLQFWWPHLPIWVTNVVALIALAVVNLSIVRAYGEVEYWLSGIKVAAIVLMIIFGALMIFFGVGNGGHPTMFGNLVSHGGFFTGGLGGFLMSLLLVAFSFGGTESVGNTAGEASNPEVTIPHAIKNVFWRIVIFYIGAVGVMVTIYPWNQIGTHGSPFVNVFSKIGIPGAAAVINFVVIIAALSCVNSGIYGNIRQIFNMSIAGTAPSGLNRKTKRGVPYRVAWLMISAQVIGVIINYLIPGQAFAILSAAVVFGLVLNWAMILIAQLGFRRTKMKTGEDKNLKFKMPLWPWSNYFALACMLLIYCIMWVAPFTRAAIYSGLCVLIVLFVVYLFIERKKKLQNLM